MKINKKNTGRAVSLPTGLCIGTSISIAITIFCSALMSYLLEKETISWNNVGYGIMGMLLVASFLGAKISLNRIKHQRVLVSILSGMLYFAILLSITALFFGGQYNAVGVTLALVMAGCGSAGLLGGNRGERRNQKKWHVVKLHKYG